MGLSKISFEPTCDRCKKTARIRIMSFFNMDMLCPECEEKEKQHPKYSKAREAELKAYQEGTRNFSGIGKPSDL